MVLVPRKHAFGYLLDGDGGIFITTQEKVSRQNVGKDRNFA
jgi:hypothetical protein